MVSLASSSSPAIKAITSSEDFLADSLESLWGIPGITHSSSNEIFVFTHPDTAVKVTLRTPDTQASNWDLHANSIWSGSLFLAKHLGDLDLSNFPSDPDDGPVRVLELGAGAGLPGITIAKIHQNCLVTVSDYPDTLVISTIEENIQRNDLSSRCRAAPYDWGTPITSLLDPSPPPLPKSSSVAAQNNPPTALPLFDVIIAADTLWNSQFHVKFLQSLTTALRQTRSARVHVVAGFHTGRFTLESFIQLVAQERWGLEVLDLRERHVHSGESRGWDVERADGEDEKERRSWLLWMCLGWKEDRLAPSPGL